MGCTYRVRKDTIHDEARKMHTVYGIEAVGREGETLSSCPDVFFDRERAERFTDLCNNEGLSLIHLPNAIEDVLAEYDF